MNDNLNLCDLLRDCELGMKLYSPAYGEVRFVKVGSMPVRKGEYVICNLSDSEDCPPLYIYFMDNGILMMGNCSECMLFPSKNNRDWSNFKKPYKFSQKNMISIGFLLPEMKRRIMRCWQNCAD